MDFHAWFERPVAGAILLAAAWAVAGCSGARAGRTAAQRIVFLGDSITDGFTYPLLVRQALAEAHRPVPVCINAGVASDTAAEMRKRLDRDVLVHRPSLVTISVGANDVLRNVPLASFEADVTAILERMKRENVPVLVLTTSVLGGSHREADRRLAEYNAILKRLAGRFGHRVADVYAAMDAARTGGAKLLEADDVHLGFEGYRVFARAVLAGLGHRGLAVPKAMKVAPLEGIVSPWRLKALPGGADPAPLDAEAVAKLRPDAEWKTLALPEADAQSHWWRDQIRRRGFALSVAKVAGKAKRYVGHAVVTAERSRTVYFNTGAQLETIWLNGRRIYQSAGWTGYHAGKERVEARLRAGDNVVVIETGGEFFVSVTDDNTW